MDVLKEYQTKFCEGLSQDISNFDCEINDNGHMIIVIDKFDFIED